MRVPLLLGLKQKSCQLIVCAPQATRAGSSYDTELQVRDSELVGVHSVCAG